MPVCVLVGPPGAGKSAVGRTLAARLGVQFRDTDEDVERTAGKVIADIFVEDGEAAFRSLERDAVAQALGEHQGVVSLGGGAVLDPDTRAALHRQQVVFLDTTLSVALRRTGMTGSRPLLLGNTRAQLKALLDSRRPLYEEVSQHTVDTSEASVADVAARVAALVTAPPAGPSTATRSVGPTGRQASP
jgi:shikimate kinase